MAKLHVELVTPERILLSTEAEEVVVPAHSGLMGVRPGHTPLYAALKPGPLEIKCTGKTLRYYVRGGFVEVGPTQVRVLADEAEEPSALDPQAAQQRLAQAQEKLKGMPLDTPEHAKLSTLVEEEMALLAMAAH
ncbi:MAG: ATP synthase F1 subunit epsilon [Proteobacteria bacterium]|nr:ATP synthase F1 subunit epsilon [Cystobacterineae bacterium]MCL2259272.1 ATP synthase F1 subunit epsilon [Cystobacterineae bacterium]MCL2314338.1 ATP synthase F1 subunit epsilon [Pseudomonadota bacterium]